MKTILFLTYATRHELTPMLNGINYVAHKEKDWNVHVVDVLRTRKEVRDLISFWKPAGCLVHCAMPCAPFVAEDFGACPVVFIDQDPKLRTSETWHVIHDSANAGRLAAQELLALNLPNYAYAAYTPQPHWCRTRQKTFADCIRLNRRSCLLSSDFVEFQPRLAGQRLEREALAWLRKLPKPIGIMASNDGLAEVLVTAALSLGLQVPKDVAIVGVDDTTAICENTQPTLSSVHPDFIRAGQLAAELMNLLLHGSTPKETIHAYGDACVITRQSTQRLKAYDSSLLKALELVRLHAGNPKFSIADVTREVGLTRRSVELHFRNALGKSFLEHLHEVRITNALRLLHDPTISISHVCDKSGFPSATTFLRIFTSHVGTSPKAYRARSVLASSIVRTSAAG